MNIEQDTRRFKHIVRGKIKKHLRKFMAHGDIIARSGKKKVVVPMPWINVPRFVYGSNKNGGVGQGPGNVGDVIDQQGKNSGGAGEPGSEGAEHDLEVTVTIEELAALLGEELELPKIQPRGSRHVEATEERYNSIRQNGPESLRHFKRTYKNALKRAIAEGVYDEEDPIIIPIRDDVRYRSTTTKMVPESQAVIIYAMDVSGSMGQEQKDLVRATAFWIDTWLSSQYKNLDTTYVIHDARAKEVDRHTFYHTRESGGTRIASAYNLVADIIDQRYPPDDWNIYVFHFSDGDSWGDDDKMCKKIILERFLPKINLFCYGQVAGLFRPGGFIKYVEAIDNDSVISAHISDREQIYDAIRTFLGKGK